MADQDQDQKTEEATPKQKERFRDRGDVSRSQDLAAVVSIAGGVGAIVLGWGIIGSGLAHLAGGVLSRLEMHGQMTTFINRAVETTIKVMAPVTLTGLVLGVAAQIAQVGFNFSFKPMAFKPEKFNPFPKIKSMLFSVETIIEVVKSVVKVAIVGALAANVVYDEVSNNGRLLGLSVVEILMKIGKMGLRIIMVTVLALAFIAVLDVLLERWRHARKMKMTREEVKQENKESEGDPLVKGRIRGKQAEMARSRMRASVVDADVVVVNPTHYSVALKYDVATDSAPVILASGVDKMAARIREEARHNSVPVVSDPPLARGLVGQGKVGKAIPPEFFPAVAALLAWVYNVTGRYE